MLKEIKKQFSNMYKKEEAVEVYFAPGRINLIGEHTDYNGGFVLPCAISYGTYLAIRKNNSLKIELASINFDHKASINIKQLSPKHYDNWVIYPLGVIAQLMKKGFEPHGMDLLFLGNIPNGAGLSSSASIEVVTAYALNKMYKMNLSNLELVKIAQKAENEFAGMNCGIMDQFAIGMGEKNSALFLNCSNLNYEAVPLNLDGYKIVITDTKKQRKLVDSKYNKRRNECEQALRMLRKAKYARNLSEISIDEFEKISHFITDQNILKRAKHIITENHRVRNAFIALKKSGQNSIQKFGKLMNQSHDSLRDNYEVTGIELDTLVNEARKIDGVIGSRMTGAGFGGCTVSIVKNDSIQEYIEKIPVKYKEKIGLTPQIYLPLVDDGVRKL